MTIRILDAAETQCQFTDASGSVWSGLRCHRDSADLVIEGDGQIPDAAREWLAAGHTPEPYVPPPLPVPDAISDRQFFQGCALRDLCSEAEALEAVKNGTLPATLEGFVQQLPADQQFNARMLLSGATTFSRSNPLTASFGQMAGMTPSELDDFWRFCAGL